MCPHWFVTSECYKVLSLKKNQILLLRCWQIYQLSQTPLGDGCQVHNFFLSGKTPTTRQVLRDHIWATQSCNRCYRWVVWKLSCARMGWRTCLNTDVGPNPKVFSSRSMGGAQAFVFLISSQVILMLLVWTHTPRTTDVENYDRDGFSKIGQSSSLRNLKFGTKTHRDWGLLEQYPGEKVQKPPLFRVTELVLFF